MQAAEEVASGRAESGGAVLALRTMPDAEIKRLFVSLIDPTAMARTDRCIHIAEMIGAYSAGAGWDHGVRLARLLGDIYRDMSDIADRPTTGGAYWDALHALGDILAYLRRVGRAYRDGKDADPMDGLEEVGATVAGIRKLLSEMKVEEPFSEPADLDRTGAVERRFYCDYQIRYAHRIEILHLLARCGYEVEELYGGFDYSPFDEESGEMVWVARVQR